MNEKPICTKQAVLSMLEEMRADNSKQMEITLENRMGLLDKSQINSLSKFYSYDVALNTVYWNVVHNFKD